MSPTVAEQIERYLSTGDTDARHRAWPGGLLESARRARADLRGALIREVKRLAGDRTHRPLPEGDPALLMRRKVEPMVRGLFPRAEQDAVLGVLAGSIFFVTNENIEPLLLGHRWDHSAWDLANMYLGSLGAELLGESAPNLVGLSEDTTCYVSPEYFHEQDPFADFIVHEAAHIFHNCKRRTVGLGETRTREWLLDIDFRRRETFAYSCEAYSRVLALANSQAERRRFADQFTTTIRIAEERVDPPDPGRYRAAPGGTLAASTEPPQGEPVVGSPPLQAGPVAASAPGLRVLVIIDDDSMIAWGWRKKQQRLGIAELRTFASMEACEAADVGFASFDFAFVDLNIAGTAWALDRTVRHLKQCGVRGSSSHQAQRRPRSLQQLRARTALLQTRSLMT